jgi:hypothetical protein
MARGQETLTRVILFTTVGDASHMIRAGFGIGSKQHFLATRRTGERHGDVRTEKGLCLASIVWIALFQHVPTRVVADEKDGGSPGFATKYTENTLYATRYIGTTIMLRPELRFDHSWDLDTYNGGKARNQLFFGMDLIYKF